MKLALEKGFVIKNNEYILWEIQKWLRERHNIQLFVPPIGAEPVGYLAIVPKCYIGKGESGGQGVFNTYEEALEAALIQALNVIKS